MPEPKLEITGEATGVYRALAPSPRTAPTGGSSVSTGGGTLPLQSPGGPDLEALADKLNLASRV